MFRNLFTASLVGLLALTATADDPAPVQVQVFPPDVHLNTSRDRQSFVVQATYADGITRDVTSQAKYQLANPALVKHAENVLTPTADGDTTLQVQYGGHTIQVPIKVVDSAKDRPISFMLDVMPVFARAGCNMGSCHGAARGKDGFRLSLFGFDPVGDYHRLTREMNGRRINLALPEESLLLEKSTGKVPHTGGKRFEENSELYATLKRWLDAGAPLDQGDIATPVALDVYPPNGVLDGQSAAQQMVVRAKYSDGTDRDVTSLAYFMTNNETSATVSNMGAVVAAERGEAFILARFSTISVGIPFVVLPKGLQYTFPQVPEFNYIDTLVNAKLRKLRITPSEVCNDETFLRRVYLDVVGLLPNQDEYNRFMNDQAPNRRERLVDELLDRKEFVEIWVMKWAELLAIKSSQQVSYKSMLSYYNWLQGKIEDNVPMNVMVQELLGATGGTFASPATNYYQNERDTLKIAENVAQVFMGMRIQCAQCHNHPFDRWTMDDYYSFAAFFAQIGRKPGEDPREIIVFNSGGGDVRHPVGNRVMAPKYLGGAVADVQGKDRRQVLAQWLASAENPFFAKNLSNMVWAHFFGRGIIDEVDDVRVSNPASNPELLDELGQKFTEYKYDFKKFVRDICNSRTYQLATQTNDTNKRDEKNFSHSSLRRIRAEVMLDIISEVTETKNKFQGLPLGARAVQIADGRTTDYFLTTFGRATRETVCSCEVKMEPTLSQALHLMNGQTVTAKMQQGGLIARRIREKKSNDEIVDELYVRCLSRRPTDQERASFQQLFQEEPDRAKALDDVFWALLNAREFLFNH